VTHRATHRTRFLRHFAWLLLVQAPGCAAERGAAYDRAFAEAERDEGAGRYAEAAHAYEGAAAAAIRARDRDEARWGAAEMTARSGDVRGALERFAAIARDDASEHQADATYRVALLQIHGGNVEQGWREMEDVPRRFPSHGVSHVAVRHLVEHASEQGGTAALTELHALERDVGSTELAPLVAYLIAVELERTGNDQGAHEAYMQIADRWPYPFGAFFDDSLWRASLIDERQGRYDVAVDDLTRMLRERETTYLVGTYERPMYVPAMMRVGTLYRDRLHDRPHAIAAFHRLYSEFAHSTRRDDALWAEAGVWRDGGDERTGCDRLGTLVREFPDSRYVPCAVERCPGLARPHTSAAPAQCHEYITRAVAGDDDAASHD
jgi:tetratricopeptide (TPR) repeat protein